MNKEIQEKIQRLQLIEQNLQVVGSQKQQIQTQLFELESALKELETSTTSYKIIGNIMIKSEPEKIKTELKEKQELAEFKLQALEKQETQVKEKAKKIQEEVLKAK